MKEEETRSLASRLVKALASRYPCTCPPYRRPGVFGYHLSDCPWHRIGDILGELQMLANVPDEVFEVQLNYNDNKLAVKLREADALLQRITAAREQLGDKVQELEEMANNLDEADEAIQQAILLIREALGVPGGLPEK